MYSGNLILIPKFSKINCDSIKGGVKEKVLNISLLLPLFSSGTYNSDAENTEETQNEEKLQLFRNIHKY